MWCQSGAKTDRCLNLGEMVALGILAQFILFKFSLLIN